MWFYNWPERKVSQADFAARYAKPRKFWPHPWWVFRGQCPANQGLDKALDCPCPKSLNWHSSSLDQQRGTLKNWLFCCSAFAAFSVPTAQPQNQVAMLRDCSDCWTGLWIHRFRMAHILYGTDLSKSDYINPLPIGKVARLFFRQSVANRHDFDYTMQLMQLEFAALIYKSTSSRVHCPTLSHCNGRVAG